MKSLTKHQAKLAQLKSVMHKIIAKFNDPSMENGAPSREVLLAAAALYVTWNKNLLSRCVAKFWSGKSSML